MKIAILLVALLPFAMGAHVQERFIESLLGGYDIVALAKQLVSQFGCDETEKQCEDTLCPQLINPLDGSNAFVTGLICAPVCKEAQILAKQYGTASSTGVDPCTGTAGALSG